MILVVDDDAPYLELLVQALASDGHQVHGCDSARAALERAAEAEPDLILSDVMMPQMGGYDFKQAYDRRFPGRLTPFVFLSSLGEPDQVVAGLDAGADDYLTKPVRPEVLRAKVRAVLRTKQRYSVPILQGDLARFPFIKVLQFCELKGLTGEVEFRAPGLEARVPFRAGGITLDDPDVLARLYDLESGSFTIHSRPADLTELAGVAPAPPGPATDGRRAEPPPMGRLSAVRLNQRVFQIQTEVSAHPRLQLLSVVLLEGNTVLKRCQALEAGSSRAQLEALLQQQHAAVENELRERLHALLHQKSQAAAGTRERFYELFEEGFEHYRRGEHAAAVEVWERARELQPEDKALALNLQIARRKLAG